MAEVGLMEWWTFAWPRGVRRLERCLFEYAWQLDFPYDSGHLRRSCSTVERLVVTLTCSEKRRFAVFRCRCALLRRRSLFPAAWAGVCPSGGWRLRSRV